MRKINTLQGLLLSGIAILLASSAVAQDSTDAVVNAIEKMQAAEQVVFTGTAKVPSDTDDGGAGGVKIIIAGAAQKKPIFSDQFELSFSPEDETLLICSEKALPGVVIYQQGDKVIKRTTFGDEAFSVSDLAGDLPQLFDFESLKKFVAKAEQSDTEEVDGVATYSYSLSKRLIRDADGVGPAAIMNPKVKAIDATFSVDSKGELAGVSLTVTRENPMAKLMMSRGGIKGADLEGMAPEMKAKVQKQLGGSDLVVQYDLERNSKPAERTQAMMKEMKSLIAE